MILNITKPYTGIQFKDVDGNLIPSTGPKRLINSTNINHEILSMLYASNFDDSKVLLDHLANLDLTDDELEVLASIGAMQLNMNDLDEHISMFEYKTLLDTYTVTSIDLPENIHAVKFFYEDEPIMLSDSDDGWNYFDKDSRKLILSIESPKEVTNVSEELHNLMNDPHINTQDLILKRSDLVKFDQLDNIIVDKVNLQTNSKLYDLTEDLEGKGDIISNNLIANGDTQYIKALEQDIDGRKKYIIIVNFESKQVKYESSY